MSEGATQYTFGDSPVARERLELVAAVFGPPSRAFLARAVAGPPALAADLGCGPGVTTRMVHEVTGARRTVGLDRSPEFVAAARAGAPDGVEFARWEAGDPLPASLARGAGPPRPEDAPDLVYARLLLAHLPRPAGLVAQWAGQLRPGGVLLADEIERIETGSGLFTEYLALTTALVGSGGAQMYAGPLLDGLVLPAGCAVADDRVVAWPVPPRDAARMFALNLAVWGQGQWASENCGPQVIARLAGGLRRAGDAERSAGITWHLRQVAVRRDAGPGAQPGASR